MPLDGLFEMLVVAKVKTIAYTLANSKRKALVDLLQKLFSRHLVKDWPRYRPRGLSNNWLTS